VLNVIAHLNFLQPIKMENTYAQFVDWENINIETNMERTRVKSNTIRSVGYNESTKILEIEFQQGGIYQYFGVSKKIHDCLIRAMSHGEYYERFIKNRYRHEKS
jgi:KTSC domain